MAGDIDGIVADYSHGPGTPSSTSSRRVAGVAVTAAGVSARVAAARVAACSAEYGGDSRV